MKGQGNQDIMVHYMKIQPHSTETAEDLHRFKWCIDSQKEAHFNSICQLGWCCLKIKELILSSWILATGVTHSILLLFLDAWLKNKTLRRTEGKADGNCQVCTMLAPSWGEGAELLHCSYRKPWWEPDCRYNIRLNQTKTHRDLLSNDLLVTWKKKKKKIQGQKCGWNFWFMFQQCLLLTQVFPEQGDVFSLPLPSYFFTFISRKKLCLPCSYWQTLQDERLGRRPFSALICRTHWILNKSWFSHNCLKGKQRGRVSYSD